MQAKRISISFRPILYDQIQTLARENNVSFSRFVENEMYRNLSESKKREMQIQQTVDNCLSDIDGYKNLPTVSYEDAIRWAWEDMRHGDFSDVNSFQKAVNAYLGKE